MADYQTLPVWAGRERGGRKVSFPLSPRPHRKGLGIKLMADWTGLDYFLVLKPVDLCRQELMSAVTPGILLQKIRNSADLTDLLTA